MEVHRARPLPCPQLIRIRKRILKNLHHRHNTRRLPFDPLDRCALLADVGEEDADAAAALRQLEGRVNNPPDGLHIVLHTQQEAGYGFAALCLA